MLNTIEKFCIGLGGFFITGISYLEVRLKGKVSKDAFILLKEQINRVETNQWRVIEYLKVPGAIEPPEEIKNNGR